MDEIESLKEERKALSKLINILEDRLLNARKRVEEIEKKEEDIEIMGFTIVENPPEGCDITESKNVLQ